MRSTEIRQRFLDFFKERGHKIVPSSSLLSQDPTVLFTTAGMQQFKDYFLGKPSPYGKRATSCQKCFRTSDIEEVGDTRHLTFLEMLGNFSFGDYFKEGAIKYALSFLIDSLGVEKEKLWITVFKGIESPQMISKDLESQEVWQMLGIPKTRIFEFGVEENFWGPTGEEGPCGPTTEIHYELRETPCEKEKNCIPNCDCGRFTELWNLVFNEYYQNRGKNLTHLKEKGVDTGMGLERLSMVLQKKSSVFETDLFEVIVKEIAKMASRAYLLDPKPYRIIADHIKSSVFLSGEGILPSNVEEGYALRRVLRRAIRFGKLLNLPKNFSAPLAKIITEVYQDIYPELKSKQTDILTILQAEEEKFEKTLEKGLKEFEKIIKDPKIKSEKIVPGEKAFFLFESFGFPLELTTELANEKNLMVDKESFQTAFKLHQGISRSGAGKKFRGVGISKHAVKIQKSKKEIEEMTKLHTATHLLHQALREILGKHVKQMGSDINSERLRFDFSHPQKVTSDEIKNIEDLVNQKIREDLEVKKIEMAYTDAIKSGALAFFKEKYPEIVTVYSIGDFSREICGGPHVNRTSEMGHFKIKKEESSGSGVRRIKGVLK